MILRAAAIAAVTLSRAPAPVPSQEVRPFFEDHLPDALLRAGPRGLLWWQWIAIPALVVLAVALGSLLGWWTRRILSHLAARTKTTLDDELIERVASPITALWAIAIITALHPWLALGERGVSWVEHLLRAGTYLVFFWAGFRSIDVAASAAGEAPWTRANPSLAGLLPLFRKLGKVVLFALGLVAVLNELGFQVASLIAGLGIGGIALALAAQKTVENLFGSVAIGVDQPFRVGDFVNVEGVTGTVETIGMRSTRIRTLDRTVVTMPNGKLADMRAETFAVRDRLRLFTNLLLAHDTRPDQVRRILAGIEKLLRGEPKLWPDGVSVRLVEIRETALVVEVAAWFQTTDWSEFTLLRQELYLRFMELIEGEGAMLAHAGRPVNLVVEPRK
jgi:MscS family membrane protein